MIDGEDEALELTNELEAEDNDGQISLGDVSKHAFVHGDRPDVDDGELVIEIEGEEELEETPLIKKLRTELRESQKREADARKSSAPAEIVVGKKPDIWDDCDGDPDKFEAELLAWNKRSEAAEKQKTEAAQIGQVSQQAFQRAHAVYQAKSETLGVKDFKVSEDAVVAALPIVTQSAIIQYMKDPEKLVYALGRHPAKLAEIAAETDPVRQILMLHDLEKRVVANRKKPPAPEAETIQRGSVSVAPTSDKAAAKLIDKAAATGDSNALYRHRRDMRAKLA